MIFTGFAWFATFLTDAHTGWAFTLGTAIQSVYLVGFAYLVSFPTGRLRGAADTALIAGAVVVVTLVERVSLLFSDSHAELCSDCPPNVLLVDRNDALANGLLQAQRLSGVSLALLMVVLLVRRWRRATTAERRSVAPVLLAGSATVTVLAVSTANDIAGEPLGHGQAEPSSACSRRCRSRSSSCCSSADSRGAPSPPRRRARRRTDGSQIC